MIQLVKVKMDMDRGFGRADINSCSKHNCELDGRFCYSTICETAELVRIPQDDPENEVCWKLNQKRENKKHV